jgi:effector-binding domain-containing protein
MIETTGMVAGQLIEQRMRFRNPFRFRGRGLWLFADRAGKTEVTWSMNGRVAFSLRAFAQTVRGMIDLDFRYGLDRLARLIEPEEAPHYSLVYLGVREIAASRYGYRTYEGSLKGLGAATREGFADLRQQFAGQGILAAGDPIAVYIRTNVKLQTTLCRMGIPIGEAAVDNLPTTEMPSHRAYVVRLQGGYAAMEVAWYHAMHRMRIENIRPDPRMPPFERYLNDPDTTPENDYLTELHIPVRQTL